jgi:hypothetical protein
MLRPANRPVHALGALLAHMSLKAPDVVSQAACVSYMWTDSKRAEPEAKGDRGGTWSWASSLARADFQPPEFERVLYRAHFHLLWKLPRHTTTPSVYCIPVSLRALRPSSHCL